MKNGVVQNYAPAPMNSYINCDDMHSYPISNTSAAHELSISEHGYKCLAEKMLGDQAPPNENAP
ncbi:MAG: hypothetical protein COA43_12705, partial [Robiginitomaculum sp.]